MRLRGPADVVGIDASGASHRSASGHQRFRAELLPFDRVRSRRLPWLFTPARANVNGQLRPWLCLVVVRKQDGVELASAADAPLPTLQIAAPAKPFIELPDLKDCWAWAHSQAAADSTTAERCRARR